MALNDGAPRCGRCGRSSARLTRVWLCADCADELDGRRIAAASDASRLARTVTACARSLAAIIIQSTNVLLSGGKDKEAMARALAHRDAIDELDAALREVGR